MFLTLEETTKLIKENKLLHIAAMNRCSKNCRGKLDRRNNAEYITENGASP
jgi:hypothetical protein